MGKDSDGAQHTFQLPSFANLNLKHRSVAVVPTGTKSPQDSTAPESQRGVQSAGVQKLDGSSPRLAASARRNLKATKRAQQQVKDFETLAEEAQQHLLLEAQEEFSEEDLDPETLDAGELNEYTNFNTDWILNNAMLGDVGDFEATDSSDRDEFKRLAHEPELDKLVSVWLEMQMSANKQTYHQAMSNMEELAMQVAGERGVSPRVALLAIDYTLQNKHPEWRKRFLSHDFVF